jgi:hypothetical protein
MGQEFRLALRIEQGMTNPVKSIAKDTRGGSLMRFHPHGCDRMAPRTDMRGPAKGNSQDSKQRIESLSIF